MVKERWHIYLHELRDPDQNLIKNFPMKIQKLFLCYFFAILDISSLQDPLDALVHHLARNRGDLKGLLDESECVYLATSRITTRTALQGGRKTFFPLSIRWLFFQRRLSYQKGKHHPAN
jgi:hypothetical protein